MFWPLSPAISIHAPRTGSDFRRRSFRRRGYISIHAPRTGSDSCPVASLSTAFNFNPRSPHGERRPPPPISNFIHLFQSTLPARGATQSASAFQSVQRYFNPRSPHGERRRFRCIYFDGFDISIHAPRTGSDNLCGGNYLQIRGISIHAPRTGSDNLYGELVTLVFQSTLPARGATSTRCCSRSLFQFQSTLPARGATASLLATDGVITFQSTLPARGATRFPHIFSGKIRYFNPRSPHGERPNGVLIATGLYKFQSTLPARGATSLRLTHARATSFQSTLPARGATQSGLRPTLWRHNFNPRSPHGERRTFTNLMVRL